VVLSSYYNFLGGRRGKRKEGLPRLPAETAGEGKKRGRGVFIYSFSLLFLQESPMREKRGDRAGHLKGTSFCYPATATNNGGGTTRGISRKQRILMTREKMASEREEEKVCNCLVHPDGRERKKKRGKKPRRRGNRLPVRPGGGGEPPLLPLTRVGRASGSQIGTLPARLIRKKERNPPFLQKEKSRQTRPSSRRSSAQKKPKKSQLLLYFRRGGGQKGEQRGFCFRGPRGKKRSMVAVVFWTAGGKEREKATTRVRLMVSNRRRQEEMEHFGLFSG